MKTARKVLSLVLSLALALSLLPGLSVTAAAWEDNPYAELVPTGSEDTTALTEKQVTFNGKQWYVINDASTAENAGTLTLLYAGSLGPEVFDTGGSNNYANSSIKTALGNITADGGYYAPVAEAIIEKTDGDNNIGKLYLLSDEEANEVPQNVRAAFDSAAWWLRTQADGDGNKVKYVFVKDTVQNNPGRIVDKGVAPNTSGVDVRPALQLDLSKVVFDPETKTFAIPATAPTVSSVTGATLVAGYGAGSVKVIATAADGHTLSYQWYQNDANSNEGGEKIDGATSATYNIPAGKTADDYYYYCVVTATRTDNSQTASVTSGVATVTVAADTDALVEKLAEEKSIDLSQYYLIPAEDMYFTSKEYWNKNSSWEKLPDEAGKEHIATKQFTIQGLPKKSLIFCKAYYAFEAVAWESSSSSTGQSGEIGKSNNLLTTISDLSDQSDQFDWWDNYSFFGFNLTKYAEGDFNTKEEADLSSISDAFRIYVPKPADAAEVNSTAYPTVADAIRAAGEGDTVELLRDVTENVVLRAETNIVLDLNGHTLTNDGRHCTIVAQNGSTLIVTDSSEEKTGTVDNTTHGCAPLFNNGGTVTLNGGTFIRSEEDGNANGGNTYYTVVNHGTMTINEGVTVSNDEFHYSSLIANGYNELTQTGYREIDPKVSNGYVEGENAANPTLTINGGTFTGGNQALKNDVNGVATIKGGSFSSTAGNAIKNLGELTISGGTFTATAEDKFALHSAAKNGNTYGPESVYGSATVTGGTFNGKLQKDESATLTVSGGEFSEELPDGYLAEGGNHALIKKDDKYIAHTHSFIYSVENDATIIASCVGDVCNLEGKTVELTIVKPTLSVYGGVGDAAATLTGLEDFNFATALTVSADSIKYYNATENNGVYTKGTEITSGAPTGAGDYLAEITLTGVKTDEGEGKSVTASVGYTIAKASAPDAGTITDTQKPTAKTGDDAVYTGSALALVSAPTSYPEGYTGVQYSTDNGETWSDQIPTATTAGDYTVKVKYTGNNYNDLFGDDINVTIAKAARSISYTTASVNKTYGDEPFTNALNITGDGTVTYATSKNAVATVAANGEVTIVGAGTATITATVTDGTNYAYEVKSASYIVSVAKASITPSVSLEGWTYGEDAKTPSVDGNTGNGTVTYTYKVKDADDSTYSATVPTNAGDYTVKATIEESDNYNGGEATANFTISQKSASITADAKSKTYGDADPELTATVEDTVGSDTLNYTLNRAEGNNFGEYDITVTLGENPNYNITTTGAKLTIGKKALTVTAKNQSIYVGQKIPDWTAESYTVEGLVGEDTVEVSVEYWKDNAKVEELDKNKAGTYTIKPIVTAGDNYEVNAIEGKLTINYYPAPSTYAPAITQNENGTVALEPKAAEAGEKVTVKVTPDEGYKLDELTVKDASGKEIELTKNEDGTYSFVQPNGKVTIEAKFAKEVKFADVPENSYYADAVDWAVEQGITNGVDENHFAPDATCTRAQAVTFLWRALGCPEPTATKSEFTDVTDANAFYYKAVLWATENGVTNGIGDGSFGVNGIVNRAQMVTFMARAMNGKANTAESFTDVPDGAFYADAAAWAKENEVSAGIGEGKFGGEIDCLRAQIVTMLYRYFVK